MLGEGSRNIDVGGIAVLACLAPVGEVQPIQNNGDVAASRKMVPPIPVDSCVFLQSRDSGAGRVHIVTVLVQGGLAKPSALSR